VEKIARVQLQMRNVSPAITQYVTATGAANSAVAAQDSGAESKQGGTP
jgi:cell division protein FtsL